MNLIYSKHHIFTHNDLHFTLSFLSLTRFCLIDLSGFCSVLFYVFFYGIVSRQVQIFHSFGMDHDACAIESLVRRTMSFYEWLSDWVDALSASFFFSALMQSHASRWDLVCLYWSSLFLSLSYCLTHMHTNWPWKFLVFEMNRSKNTTKKKKWYKIWTQIHTYNIFIYI